MLSGRWRELETKVIRASGVKRPRFLSPKKRAAWPTWLIANVSSIPSALNAKFHSMTPAQQVREDRGPYGHQATKAFTESSEPRSSAWNSVLAGSEAVGAVCGQMGLSTTHPTGNDDESIRLSGRKRLNAFKPDARAAASDECVGRVGHAGTCCEKECN